MMRMIDVDALITYIQNKHCGSCKDAGDDHGGMACTFCSYGDIIDAIDKWATMHQINKTAYWKKELFMLEKRCSNCGMMERGLRRWKFCPNCGARIVGGDVENN